MNSLLHRLLLTAGIGLVMAPVTAQRTIAVLDFEAINISRDEAYALCERFRTEIQSLDQGNIYLDRGAMQAVLQEQGFQQFGCTNNECAVEIGNLLNAGEIIVGSVGLVGSTYSVNVRSIAVGTGTITKTVSRDFRDVIDQVLSPGMRQVAEQFSGRTGQPPATGAPTGKVTGNVTEILEAVKPYFEEVKPYLDEVRRRTESPDYSGLNDDIYFRARQDARADISLDQWIAGPACVGTGCGTCYPLAGFLWIPLAVGWAYIDNVQLPAKRWDQIAGQPPEVKKLYVEVYKRRLRQARLSRALYSSTAGFIAGALIYSLR